MKLWAGRFQKETDALVNDFNSSISFDARMYREDITGSIAHAAMLGRQGIIKEHEAEKIIDGLKAILADIEAGQVEFSLENEDIHMNIETILTQRIGDTGKRLHTARSRNDQVAVDFRMYVRKEIQAIIGLILDLEKVLVRKAEANLDTVMPGYTHLQRAQPTTFAHAMMAYANMFKRDVTRLEDCLARMDECPLGAGALATSTYPVDRFQTAQALGFSKPTDNSLDSVSDRDFALEFLSACSILMMHLSRFSEEIILWCSWEFKFVELDDAYSTGSSIMPQKKNPDVAELLRGKTGRVYGSLITLLTVMKGLPLAYNKDMQEDKECVFDAIDTVELCLPVFTAMLDTLAVRKENMRRAAAGGFINATDCADYLVKKGMPFREAYLIVGRLVSQCIRAGETLDTLSLKDFKAVSKVFDEDVYQALELRTCVNGRKVCGGPAADSVRVQIGHIWERLSRRTDLELLRIGEARRKDPAERKKYLNAADLVFLCLPDAAAWEAVGLIENGHTRIIDASTAHRTASGWVYGFPELYKDPERIIGQARRVANPGCHATGFLASAAPLSALHILLRDCPLTCFSLTGYSGGGRKMIAQYEAPDKPAELFSPRLYGTGLRHKHLTEMQKVAGL